MLYTDRDVLLKILPHAPFFIKYASKELRADREVMLEAFKWNIFALQYASEELLADRYFMLETVKQDASSALFYASEELRSDRCFMLEAVKCYLRVLDYASEDLLADRYFILEAVKHKGGALGYASEELKADREIVLAAVSQNGSAIQNASEELQSDKGIVLTAVKHGFWVYLWGYSKFKKDAEFMKIVECVKDDFAGWNKIKLGCPKFIPKLEGYNIEIPSDYISFLHNSLFGVYQFIAEGIMGKHEAAEGASEELVTDFDAMPDATDVHHDDI